MLTVWLQLYQFSIVASLLFTLNLLLRKKLKSIPTLDFGGSALGVLSAIIMAVDGQYLLNGFNYRQLQPWTSIPLVVALSGYIWLCFARQDRVTASSWSSERAFVQNNRATSVALLATTLAILTWSGLRLNSIVAASEVGLFYGSPGQLVERQDVIGMTDRGNSFPLFRWEATEDQFKRYAQDSKERNSQYHDLITQAEPTLRYNCHGWVFTGGNYLMQGEFVEQILCDNEYTLIEHPEEDDIVIYRSPVGRILHTGLVRSVLPDKSVLIESKWGIEGQFLHRPENQPYSQDFKYYRSSRQSHLISVRPKQDNGSELVAWSGG
jgi:hypothetical protein